MKYQTILLTALFAMSAIPGTQAIQFDGEGDFDAEIVDVGLARVCAVGTSLVCVDVLPGGECWTAASDGVVYTSDKGVACHPNNSVYNFCAMERTGCASVLMSYDGAVCAAGVGVTYGSRIPLVCVEIQRYLDLVSTNFDAESDAAFDAKIDPVDAGLARVCAVGTSLVCVDVLPGGECWTAASDGIVLRNDVGVACHPNNSAYNFCGVERTGCASVLMSYDGATCVLGVGLSYTSRIPLVCIDTAAVMQALAQLVSTSEPGFELS